MRKTGNLKTEILTLTLLTFTLLFTQCKKEEFQNIPDIEKSNLGAMPDGLKQAATGITSSSYYLVNSLPSGYVKDGSRDYTSYIQAAVNKYSNIVFPGFPLLVNSTGIKIGSYKTITFESGSEIRLKGTSNDFYNILNIASASNVTLYNPVIVGDRYSHIGIEGESGMGIGIRGSSNISIYNAKISNCWGDGIYIGQTNSSVNCKNIIIKDAYLRKNRRDGLTIISVDGLLVDNIYAGYTDGTKPWCGINVEPNNPACELKNIRINNARTENNGSRGIQIVNRRMLGTVNKTTDITIVNHVDIGSPKNAFKFSCMPGVEIAGKMYGKINLINPTYIKSSVDDVQIDVSSNEVNYKLNIYSPAVTLMSGKVLTYSEIYSRFMDQSSRVELLVSNTIPDNIDVSVPTEEPTTSSSSGVVFAVNSGGSSFNASNGITYSADKNYSNGSVYTDNISISNTSDDILYQNERFGDFTYSIPVSDGTYEVTFKFAEIFHTSSGDRVFDVLAEGSSVISNLDIYALAGLNKAYDITKTISVNDGTLNLQFRTDLDNAKIAAFHVIKK